MRTEKLLRPALLTLLLSMSVEAAESLPEPVEAGAAESADSFVHEGDAAALDGFGLDESIFTEIEPFTVPATPIALPEDQQEE